MEVHDFFNSWVESDTSNWDASRMRDRLYETTGRLLIFAADQEMSDNVRESYADVLVAFFEACPAHVRFEVTPDLIEAVGRHVEQEAFDQIRSHLATIAIGRAANGRA